MNSSTIRAGLSPLLVVCVAGCGRSGFHSPAIDVLGSYFPAWMICMLIGLALTLIARLVLVALKLDADVRPAPIVYPCLMTVFTLAAWLLFFQN
jgi:YtcA family